MYQNFKKVEQGSGGGKCGVPFLMVSFEFLPSPGASFYLIAAWRSLEERINY